MSWVILRVAQHKGIQKDVQQEIRDNLDSEKRYEDYLRQDNTLLAASILETSRLHPILRKYIKIELTTDRFNVNIYG